jgi:hypothetical protein
MELQGTVIRNYMIWVLKKNVRKLR